MSPRPSLATLELRLDLAIRHYRHEAAAALEREREGFEFAFLLSRLGLASSTVAAARTARSAADLPPALQAEIAVCLTRENERLRRLARSGSGGYDLSRHLSVRRAIHWVKGGAQPAPSPLRAPGSVLNARFKRHHRRAGRCTLVGS